MITPGRIDTSVWKYNVPLQIFSKVPQPISPTSACCSLVEYNGVLYGVLGWDRSLVQTFDLQKQVWGEIYFENCPKPLYCHAGLLFGHEVFCHGGMYADGYEHNDALYAFNLISHEVRTVRTLNNYGPLKRLGHTFEKWNSKGYMFGGVGGKMTHFNLHRFEGGTNHNDVWEFDPSNQSWKELAVDAEVKPPKRRSHASCVAGDCMYISGGYDGKTEFADIWQFDLFLKKWKQFTNLGLFPSRRFHSMTTFDDSLYILGGITSSKSDMVFFMSDYYRFDTKEIHVRDWIGLEDVVFILAQVNHIENTEDRIIED
jgi:hypothetical protein